MYGLSTCCTPFPGSLSVEYPRNSSTKSLKGTPDTVSCISVHLLYANSTDSNAIVSVLSYAYSIPPIVAGYTSRHFIPYVRLPSGPN